MRTIFSNDAGRTGWLDHLLATVAGSLVLYSVGQAISRPEVGTIFLGLFWLGNLFSWIFGTALRGRRVLAADGVLYLVFTIILFFVAGKLNPRFGDDPFTGIFYSVGFLSWMVVMGSFAAWRDSTLLFQAVPSIAIFGLVGCYDTFRNVIYFFFAFLLCIATLFARINARNMLDYAIRSGAPIARESSEESSLAVLRKGPWRSVAGPTWALISAGAIVLLSLAGAPIVQESVQSVVGHLRLPIPQNVRSGASQSFFRQSSGVVQIGTGPVSLSNEPVLRIQMDRQRYLRTGIYYDYVRRGWDRYGSLGQQAQNELQALVWASQTEIKDSSNLNFSIEMLTTRGGALPVPAETIGINGNHDVVLKFDGTYTLPSGAALSTPYVGIAKVAPEDATGTEAQRELPPSELRLITSTSNIPESVQQLAQKVTLRKNTDWAKAMAIQNEISGRIVYDKNAEAVPAGTDPVEYALFTSKRGYCDLFATSMVLMARSVGLPARYVVGFYPFGEERDGAGRFTVRERDAHAWAEIFFKGVGWVPFDATDGAQEAEGAGRSDSTSGLAWLNAAWFIWSVKSLAFLIFAGGVLLTVRYVANRPVRDPRHERLVQLYGRFNQVLAKRSGTRRMIEQTPEEYFAALRPTLAEDAARVEALTAAFLYAMFGPSEVEDAALDQMQIEIRELEKSGGRRR
jgi:transglutaminase-like putative cysteine protease